VPKKTNFKDLSEDKCKLLYAVLQMQKASPPIKATKMKIMESTGFSESKVGKLLYQITRISQSRYIQTVSGESPVRYRLFTQRLVTQADTAHLLLLLLECPHINADGLIIFEEAVKWLNKQTGFSEEIVRDRLDKAISQEYLTKVPCQDVICLEKNDRLVCEQIFLKMVAGKANGN
jgi:hypothetical protein